MKSEFQVYEIGELDWALVQEVLSAREPRLLPEVRIVDMDGGSVRLLMSRLVSDAVASLMFTEMGSRGIGVDGEVNEYGVRLDEIAGAIYSQRE